MDVSIIVVSYNTIDLLRECIESIYRETKDVEFEVFVVDNDSHDGSADMVEQTFSSVYLIRSGQNVGFASGNNIAIKETKGRYVLLLNPDTQLLNNAVKELVDFMDANPDAGASGSMLLDDGKELRTVCRKFSRIVHEVGELMPLINRMNLRQFSRDLLPDEFDYRAVGEADYVQGACLMVRREVIDQVGMLDERYFMYSEEEDWCYAMKMSGWKIMYVPSAVIVHYHGMSTRQRSLQMLRELYRSKLKYFMKNYGRVKGQLFRLVIVVIMGIRIPLYALLNVISGGKREETKKIRDQSLAILSAMFSSR